MLADIFDDRSSVTFRHELDSQFPWWRESNLWRKANRYPHYDQFLNFVAFASSESIPEHAKSKWCVLLNFSIFLQPFYKCYLFRTALACAALIEVHYFIRFLKSMSKPLNEEFKDYYKHTLDNAFEIYQHCDLVCVPLILDTGYVFLSSNCYLLRPCELVMQTQTHTQNRQNQQTGNYIDLFQIAFLQQFAPLLDE